MDVADLIKELSQVSNALALLGLVMAGLGLLAAWWFFYAPRKIQVQAKASLPFIWLDPAKLPFTVHVTNINTRQVKIHKIGFQTIGRKSSSFELTLDAGLLNTDKLLITEGDATEVSFDGYKIAYDIARSLQGFNLPLDPTELKIWLYITHGRKIFVEVEPKLSSKIIASITAISAMSCALRQA